MRQRPPDRTLKPGCRPSMPAICGSSEYKGIVEPTGAVIVRMDSSLAAGSKLWVRSLYLVDA